MELLKVRYVNGGVYLPALGLWLDAHDPQRGPERVFVSHAHSDHIAEHREVILSAPTAKLMTSRIGGGREEHILPCLEPRRFEGHSAPFEITLFPAGHIFGSAMSLIRTRDGTLLYTGDFKLRPGRSAEPCQPVHADVLIMESTFGQPRYVFPPAEAVLEGIIRFCREALDNDEIPVLLGYSLGKSQEILCCLSEAGLPIMLHGTVHRMTRIYEQFGRCFPKYERYEPGNATGKVLVCPPNVTNSAMLRNLGRHRSAIMTGWAVDPGCRYRYQCDAAFPLSDHADFPDLLEFVRQVSPQKIYTLHGFAADFAQTLRASGYQAQALSQNEQLGLGLTLAASDTRKTAAAKPVASHLPAGTAEGAQNLFSGFAETCSTVAKDPRKLEKIRVLSQYLSTLQGDSLQWAATWFSGRPFPPAQNKVLQLGWALLRDALCAAAGMDEAVFHQVYLKHSDLGETAFELLNAHTTGKQLTLASVGHLFQRLHAARGPLAKRPILQTALEQCSGVEAKFLVKIITGDLRIGLKEGLVEEAIGSAFAQDPDAVRKAHLLVGDLGATAALAQEQRLHTASIVPFRPVKFMLASPEETAAGILKRMRERIPEAGPLAIAQPGEARPVLWLEDKYDGVRCQLHKADGRVAFYSRDLKDITQTFPELEHLAQQLESDLILDGEILAMRGEQVLPFSDLQKRLGRRQRDLFMQEEVPIRFIVFDLLWSNGVTQIDKALRERRALLQYLRLPSGIQLARISTVSSAEDIDATFDAARARGNEGLVIKDPESPYAPGRRGLAWLKLKKAYATLDCVVVGAEYGHGKRSKVLSDYTFAVRDDNSGELLTIGKAYTGLTDAEIADLTGFFLKRATQQHGRYFQVPPEVVLEIAFDRLQPSNRHKSGLAMRFPRILRIRTDKSAADIDTLSRARSLAGLDSNT